jgi:ATP-dependent Lhr-like helicase
MDIEGLENLLRRIESGSVQCIARDLPEPSPLAHEILNAKPYAFLDNAPLEERRTQAVYTRRAGSSSSEAGLGILDPAAIEKVCTEAWPRAANADELHEALLLSGAMTGEEVRRLAENPAWLDSLISEGRVRRLATPAAFWIATERLAMLQAVYPGGAPVPCGFDAHWERSDAVRELLRGRLEVIGPVTAAALAVFFELPPTEIEAALLALEAEGFVLRGKFHPNASDLEWCDRRLLARIHRLTIHRLRAEIEPVSLAAFQRFLLAWQRADPERRGEGAGGVAAALELLDGYELPAAAWEPEVLSLRVNGYKPEWLDQLCFTGRIGWGRLTSRSPSQNPTAGRSATPVRSSPVALFARENLPHWLALSTPAGPVEFSPDARQILEILGRAGALFFGEIVRQTGMLPSRVEQALAELTAHGRVTADSFEGLRALLVPEEKRISFGTTERRRQRRAVTSVEFAGRWSLLRAVNAEQGSAHDEPLQVFARVLLRRYGVVFRKLLEKESLAVSWFELIRLFRRLEARGEIRGGYFVSGVSGEQFALPEAIGLLRSIRKTAPKGGLTAISGADPLNLAGILTPGPRIAAVTAHRILLRDGVPIAMLKAGEVISLGQREAESDRTIEHALRVGSMPVALRSYYG